MNCPVVSIGNIVVGGTGKTPFVLYLAKAFSNRKVAILSREYGKVLDEPLLLQRRAPFCKVYVGKDRRDLAKRAKKEGAELILLDDGFQYRKLFRDIDIVLLSKEDPFGKGHFLPWGFLRDSPKRLSKADLVVGTPTLEVEKRVEGVFDFSERKKDIQKGERVVLFSAIARPESFEKTVSSLGFIVLFHKIFADHEKPTFESLLELAKRAKEEGAERLLCTEKDFVKWRKDSHLICKIEDVIQLNFVEISLEIKRGQKELQNLIAKIDRKIDNFKICQKK